MEIASGIKIRKSISFYFLKLDTRTRHSTLKRIIEWSMAKLLLNAPQES